MRRQRFPVFRTLFVGLALAFVASAVAFRTAAVNNTGLGATITNTDTAALAMVRVDTSIATYVNGALHLDFSNQQPDSTYTYNGVFQMVNKTNQSHILSVASVTGEATPGVHLTLSTSSPAATLWQNGANGGVSVTVPANQAVNIDITVKVDPSASLGGAPLAITINGQ